MKKLILLLLSLLLLSDISAQTISSTVAGGHWNTASTWVGGVIPGENNNVIINGPVVIPYVTVNNLTVNSGGSIEDEPSGGRNITVKGSFINYGTIKNTYAGVTIYARGSVNNYGTMINSGLCFNGSGSQSFASSQVISCSSIWKDPNGQIIAASNIVIDSVTNINLYGDTLNMGSYKLTKFTRWDLSTTISNGLIQSNGDIDIAGKCLSNLAGSFSLVGNNVMEFGTITVYNDLKIKPGKIIQDECCAGRQIHVLGNIINEGTIRNGYGGLAIYAYGNVTNNGVMINSELRFRGNSNQLIGGTNKFSPGYILKEPNGRFNAASNLVIDSVTNVGLYGDTLNMGSYKLTKYTRWDLSTTISEGLIQSNGDIDIAGRCLSNLAGNFSLVGNNVMEFGTITVYNDLKIKQGKIIQDECCAGRQIYVMGNIINEGTIRNGYGGLGVYAYGNVTNNGVMINSELRFRGNSNQLIGGTNKFSPGYILKEPNGKINAASHLVIDSVTNVNLYGDTLNMGSYKLTKYTNWDLTTSISDGFIQSNGDIDITGRCLSNLTGDFTLIGSGIMECGTISVHGNMTIAAEKTITDECCAGRNIYVTGNLYNYGSVRNEYGGLGLEVRGNLYNFSTININWVTLKTEGINRTISGVFNSSLYLEQSSSSGNITVDGLLQSNIYTRITANTILNIPAGSSFICNGDFWIPGSINNQGIFYSSYRTYYNSFYSFEPASAINLKLIEKTADTTTILVNTNLPHPKMTSSVKRWWRLKSNGKITNYTMALHYDDNLLNGNNEDDLEAFLSPDSGKTWKRISNPVNTARDPVNNILYVGTDAVPVNDDYGDIIISSGRIVNIPSISSSIGGRSQIRVGPPNRYTITYWNNDNYPTGRFCFQLQTNNGVHIKSIFSKEIETGKIIEIPIDSLTYDGYQDEVILFVESLAPKEVRSFDIILTAVPGMGKAAEFITFTAVALWVGGAILEEYISNTIVEGCYEMWRPVAHDQSLTDATINCVKNSMGKAVTVENGAKGIAKKAAGEIIEKTGRVVVWPVMLAKDILDCLGNTVKGMKDYVNGNFDKQSKDLTKVTSWDPNAKEGPAGFGTNGYMATSAPMLYTIFFENKKEATAPAWKVVIYDTLDTNVFDVNSVEFREMSHSMGITERDGNILKWDFTDIELPPNITPPEGEGWVKFIVHPKSDLQTGTQLTNRAVIKFDLNPWIATDLFVNTLDYDPPVTNPQSLVQLQGGGDVLFSWNTNDGAGSGIKNTSVYMAAGDGPFTLAAVSDSSSAVIKAEWVPDQLYKFYLLSQDNVGNSEKNPVSIMEIVTGVEDQNIVPEKFELSQNYPNPFNPETRINYSLPEQGYVELKIFNILGEEVAALINEEKEAGYHSVMWNASKYSSGVYLYKLSCSGKSFVKKMMLLK